MNANNANNGGGFYNAGGSLTLTGIHLNANVAKYRGGGFYNECGGTVAFGAKTSIVSNKSSTSIANSGSGYYNQGAASLITGTLTKLQSNKPTPQSRNQNACY
jgi:hypothetical protein